MFLLNMLYKNGILFLVIIMKIDLEEWLSAVDDRQDLFSLNIPGTHDCATDYVQFSLVSRCQDLDIHQQLCLGVRALDVRVESMHDTRLGIVHGIAKTYNTANHLGPQMDMSDILEHCYSFLDQHPSECIILQFKNDSGKEQERCFANLFYTYIKGNEDRWFLRNAIPTVGEARGRIVLVRRCYMDSANPEFNDDNTGIDFSAFQEQDQVVPEPLVLDTQSLDGARFIIQDRYKYKAVPRWSECIQPFLDSRTAFDGTYIVCYLSTAGDLLGPGYSAKHINARFLDYPLEKERYYGIFYMDFPTPELTEKIISTNF